MDWRPVQAVPYLSPKDSRDKLQPFHDPELDKQLKHRWMDKCARVVLSQSQVWIIFLIFLML